jgi:hypothetical protein
VFLTVPPIFVVQCALVAVCGDAIDQLEVGLHHGRWLLGIVHFRDEAVEVHLYISAHGGILTQLKRQRP